MITKNTKVSLFQTAQYVCNTIFHTLVVLVSVVMFHVFFNNFEKDAKRLWHIFLSSCAFVPLMAEGIVLMYDLNVWSLEIGRVQKAYLHGFLLSLSTIAISVGILFETVSKAENGQEHFQTFHAVTGLISWILAVVSIIFGLFVTYSHTLKNLIKPVILKFIHNYIGIVGYAVGILSLCLGLYYWGFSDFVKPNDQQATVGLVGIIGIWTVLGACKSLYYQVKTIIT
nr:uncharacterized protein LOC111503567 isoform X1 [Leptinotarsa decemlineata]